MLALSFMLAAVQDAALVSQRPPAARPELLVLASPHLANNNRDVVKTNVEDVRTPARQVEIEQMVAALARFRPTRIAVEWKATDQAGLDRRYADYRAGKRAESANEIDQIAFRLAARLGLDRVDAIDWNEMPAMPEVEYDWTRHEPSAPLVTAIRANGDESEAVFARYRRCASISGWYRYINAPDHLASMHRIYFDYARIGDVSHMPGAAWVGNWYARNLRIFANLERLARPNDRLLVLYGAGHGYLLRQFAQESGAFRLVDPASYLPEARSTCETERGRD